MEDILNFIIYMAISLDGFISDKNGSIDFLERYNEIEFGYDDFLKDIDCLVIGAKTYEQVLGFGDWPYKNKKSYVLSSKTFEDENIEACYNNINELLSELKSKNYKNIWVMGGARVCQDFINMKLIDTIDLFIMPVVLNDGIKLLKNINVDMDIALQNIEIYGGKIARMLYKIKYNL